jgi:hypothetical protein
LPVSALERLRVPQQDGAVIAVPPLSAMPDVLAHNRTLLGRATGTLLGRPLPELRRQARRSAADAARAYLAAAGEPVPTYPADALLMSGHQPELFHPGVWVKNFALHRLALTHGAAPLNLIVDNDTAKTTLLRVPAERRPAGHSSDGDVPLYHTESVPFDVWGEQAPYEERPVRDEAVFASLPERVRPAAAGWNFAPMLPDFWQEVLNQARRTKLLGERLAGARRSFERRWGCHNLELPVSLLCQTEPFAWFACHLLLELPRFHTLYNETVHHYRERYGLRSRNHPVPDLAAAGEWLEAPFWAWRAGQGRRGRLMVRRTAAALEMRVGEETWPALPLCEGCGPEALTAAWQDLQRRGFKVRSRALTNTLYARLFLADLFIHGIGGGKYDELTDALLKDFYGIEPPAFLVLSATLLLPFAENHMPVKDCRGLQHELRDVHWNPQRYLSAEQDGAVAGLLAQKRDWIGKQQPPTRRGRRERFRTLQRLTAELRTHVAGRGASLRHALLRCEQRRDSAAVLRRRDYAFCLYPEAQLWAFCVQFLKESSADFTDSAD